MTTPAMRDLLAQLTLAPADPLSRAIETLSRSPAKILLVCAPDGRLQGIVTDQDIRRALLDGAAFDIAIAKVMNAKPITVAVDADEDKVAALMKARNLSHLPVVDAAGRVATVRFIHEFIGLVGAARAQHEPQAVVMAGGFGTRLKPLTERVPKPMLTIGGKPLLFIVLDQILNEGFKRVWVTLHYRADDIAAALRSVTRYRDRVHCIVEETPLGTAGGLTLLPERPTAPFLVMNADLLVEVPLNEMWAFHVAEGNVATMATREEEYEIPYGVVDTDGNRVTKLREKPKLNYRVNTGVYMLSPTVLDLLVPNTPLPITSLFERLIADGAKVGGYPVGNRWIDVGTHATLGQARALFDSDVT